MNGRLKVIGLLLTPLVIGFTAIPFTNAQNNNSMHQEHGAQDNGSVWLVIVLIGAPLGPGKSMEKIQMRDMNQCNEQGALYVAYQGVQKGYREGRQFICIQGK